METDDVDRNRPSLMALSAAVREMTPTGAKAIPANPSRFNLLARPSSNNCRICGLPGHSSANVQQSVRCRTAIVSLIGFWEDAANHVSFLYQHSDRFQRAVQENKPTYEMRLDNGGLKGGDIEDVLVERLTRGWLKFQSHISRNRAKANVILDEAELGRYEDVSQNLNGFLLNGLTCKSCARCTGEDVLTSCTVSDLFERSVARQQ
jgi:CCR4-NOT transcription complex subunit 2